MASNIETFTATYRQAFFDAYPQLPRDRAGELIEKALAMACQNIRSVVIDTPGFKLTAKRLGIKCTYKAFDEYLKA